MNGVFNIGRRAMWKIGSAEYVGFGDGRSRVGAEGRFGDGGALVDRV